ncbi:MAG: hypothetical protein AAGI17_10345 [Planctomycetota bacterium]
MSAMNERQTRGRRAFTIVEILISVGLIATITVAVAAMFATVSDTVTTGRRVSKFNRLAARIERVMRRDIDSMIRDRGFLVIRNELSRYGDGDPTTADTTPDPVLNADLVALTPNDVNPRLRRMDELMFFASGDFETARRPLAQEFTASASEARIYYGHGWRYPESVEDIDNASASTNRYLRPHLSPDINENIVRRDFGLGVPQDLGSDENPNEYASDWTLLRHVTLLVPRPTGVPVDPTSGFPNPALAGQFGNVPEFLFGLSTDAIRPALVDNTRQVGGQPAAQSIFRSMSALGGQAAGGSVVEPIDQHLRSLPGTTDPERNFIAPQFVSGLVDIATGELAEIDAVIRSPYTISIANDAVTNDSIGGIVFPMVEPVVNGGFRLNPFADGDGRQPLGTVLDQIGSLRADGFSARSSGGIIRQRGEPGSNPANGDYVFFTNSQAAAQLWMLDAMPTEVFDTLNPSAPQEQFRIPGSRIRYEASPPRSVGLVDPPQNSLPQSIQYSYEVADQEMLASPIFLEGCSEFIVEFSFGIIDRRPVVNSIPNPNLGQPIWHGLRRWEENDNVEDDYQYNPDRGDVLVADQITARDPNGGDIFGGPTATYDFRGSNGNQARLFDVDSSGPQTQAGFKIPEELKAFWRPPPTATPPPPGEPALVQAISGGFDAAMVSFIRPDRVNFGPVQQLLGEQPVLTGPQTNAFPYNHAVAEYTFGLAIFDDDEFPTDANLNSADDYFKPWPRPRLIRVTLRFVDPTDPETEQTYQVVFRVPERGAI